MKNELRFTLQAYMQELDISNFNDLDERIGAENKERLKELEEENRRLKKMYAEAQMDREILKDALAGKY